MAAAKAQMVKWGNSLAVRIPKSVAEEARLSEGDYLSISVAARGTVAIRAVDRPKTLAELVAKITPENMHREQEWGKPVGAEIW